MSNSAVFFVALFRMLSCSGGGQAVQASLSCPPPALQVRGRGQAVYLTSTLAGQKNFTLILRWVGGKINWPGQLTPHPFN